MDLTAQGWATFEADDPVMCFRKHHPVTVQSLNLSGHSGRGMNSDPRIPSCVILRVHIDLSTSESVVLTGEITSWWRIAC